jgi:hypothetical protein
LKNRTKSFKLYWISAEFKKIATHNSNFIRHVIKIINVELGKTTTRRPKVLAASFSQNANSSSINRWRMRHFGKTSKIISFCNQIEQKEKESDSQNRKWKLSFRLAITCCALMRYFLFPPPETVSSCSWHKQMQKL